MMFQWQETIPHNIMWWMKIRLNPKTRGKMSPCQTPLVMAPPMEAQTKTATQTKSRHPIRKLWVQAARKSSSLKNPMTTMQCKG